MFSPAARHIVAEMKRLQKYLLCLIFLFLSNSLPTVLATKCSVLLVKLFTYHVTDSCCLVLQAFDSRIKNSGFTTPMKVSIKRG